MKWATILFPTLFFTVLGVAQESLTLFECYGLAMANHPVGEKRALLSSVFEKEIDKLKSDRLPQINLFALAGIQSETIEFPFENPAFPQLDLPLYRAVTGVQLQYALYDGGFKKARESQETAALQADLFEIEVELDQLKAQVNQAFFGLQLQRSSIRVLEVNRASVMEQIRNLEVLVENGVVLPGQLKQLNVKALELEAAIEEAVLHHQSLAATLGRLTGTPIDTSVEFLNPPLEDFGFTNTIKRPEKKLLQLERERIAAGADLLQARRKPLVLVGGTAGAGYPNQLNLFDVSFRPYGTAELSLNWSITDWGKTKKDQELLSLRSKILENQEAIFDYQIELQEDQYRAQIKTLEARLVRDQEILQLQEEILTEVTFQLENGVTTTTEYIDQLNKRLEAQLQFQIHQIQLTQAQIDYLTYKGLL